MHCHGRREQRAGCPACGHQQTCKRQVSGSNPLTGSQVKPSTTRVRLSLRNRCSSKPSSSSHNCPGRGHRVKGGRGWHIARGTPLSGRGVRKVPVWIRAVLVPDRRGWVVQPDLGDKRANRALAKRTGHGDAVVPVEHVVGAAASV